MGDVEAKNAILGRHLSPELWPKPPNLGVLECFSSSFLDFSSLRAVIRNVY